jgi:hypothetical protein
MRSQRPLFFIAAVSLLAFFAAVCASGPRPLRNARGKLHLMSTRDFAQILLAHCEAGVELGRGIETSEVSPNLKQLGATLRVEEERDRSDVAAWIAKQSTQPSAVGDTHSAGIRAEHLAVVEQLRKASPATLNDYVLRVLDSHYREQLAFLEETPVEDDELQTLVDAIWRRLSVRLKELSQRV